MKITSQNVYADYFDVNSGKNADNAKCRYNTYERNGKF
jgi:hypothetical protein